MRPLPDEATDFSPAMAEKSAPNEVTEIAVTEAVDGVLAAVVAVVLCVLLFDELHAAATTATTTSVEPAIHRLRRIFMGSPCGFGGGPDWSTPTSCVAQATDGIVLSPVFPSTGAKVTTPESRSM